jgi:hypothetical protein
VVALLGTVTSTIHSKHSGGLIDVVITFVSLQELKVLYHYRLLLL